MKDPNKSRGTLKDVVKSDLFGVENNQSANDVTINNPYKSNHKSTVQTRVFLGPIFLEECAGIIYEETTSKTPVYHYSSEYYTSVLRGKYIVRGQIQLYETRTNDLLATIAKYKELLRIENARSTLIREIVNQRNNLLRSNINIRLIEKYGIEKAAKITDDALKRVNTELITGSDWDIPKLIIVTGDLTDPNPVVKVYENITFTKQSSSDVPDGSTKIEVIEFMGSRRPVRDIPNTPLNPDKWYFDIEKIVESFVDNMVGRLKNYIGVSVKKETIPIPLNPNNFAFAGSLPSSISSWGPELCLTNFRVEQMGAPRELAINYGMYVYRPKQKDEVSNELIATNQTPIYDDYIYSSQEIYGGIIGLWKHFFPDPNYLIMSTVFASRSLPLHKDFSYSWITPPPAIPGIPEDNLVDNYSYQYIEENAEAVTGSTLTQAFFSVGMHTTENEDNVSYYRKPVRSLAYVPTPKLESNDAGSDQQELKLRDIYPLDQGIMDKLTRNGFTFPDDLNNDTAKFTSDGVDIVVNTKTGAGQYIDDNVYTDIEFPGKGYEAEEWFLLTPNGMLFGSIFGALSLGNSSIMSFLEESTLGIIGNIDKANQYSIDLETISERSFGTSVDLVGVQTYFLVFDENKYESGIYDTFMKQVSLALGSHTSITRSWAVKALYLSECVKNKAFDYTYSLNGFDKTGPKSLEFIAAWDREFLLSNLLGGKLPLILIRVYSDVLSNKVNEGTELSSMVNTNTYISQATLVPAAKVTYNVAIRCDRTYVTFDDRWPVDMFDTLANIPTSGNVQTDLTTMSDNTKKGIKTFSSTLKLMKQDGVFQGLIQGLTGAGLAVAGAGGLALTGAGVMALGLTGAVGSAALDTIEGIYTIASELPVVSQALNLLEGLGIDLTTLFKDSDVSRGSKMSPTPSLKGISVYSKGERYIVNISKIVELIEDEITSRIKAMVSNNPTKYELPDVISNKSGALAMGNMKDKILSYLTYKLESGFTSEENVTTPIRWEVTRVRGANINKLIQIPSYPGEFEDLSNATTIYMVTRINTSPSQFVIDEAIKNPDDYKNEDSVIVKKGVEY